jgi:hypothetical protein
MRVVQHRGAQLVVGVQIGLAHAFVDGVLDAAAEAFERTSMPIFRNTLTMPVSWQIGRWPSAHILLLVRICAIASLAAGLCSRS